jgi:hypothetical protein
MTEPKPKASFFNSTYARILFVAVLVFIGVTAGVYVGNWLSRDDSGPADTPRPAESSSDALDDQYVTFTEGDAFPHEQFTTADGLTGNFDTLLFDQKTMLLFVSIDCEPCMDLMRFWPVNVAERLLPDVKVYACVSDRDGGIPPELAGLFDDIPVLVYDGDYWSKTYAMKFNPVIIGVDESGIVRNTQFGFNRYVAPRFREYFFKPM